MHCPPDRRRERRRDIAFAVTLVAVLAAYNNVVVIRLPGYPASYLPANLTATVLLLATARAAGLRRPALGLAPEQLAAGVRWGSACFVLADGPAVAVAVLAGCGGTALAGGLLT